MTQRNGMAPTALRSWLLVGAGALLLASLAAGVYWFATVRPWLEADLSSGEAILGVALCAGITLLHLSLRWLRWHYLLRRFTRRVPTRVSTKVFSATLLALLTPFNAAELLRALPLRKRYAGTAHVIWVWLIERIFDVGSVAIWFLLPRSAWLPVAVMGALVVLGALLERRMPRHRSWRSALQLGAGVTVLSVSLWGLPVLALWSVLGVLGQPAGLATAGHAFALSALWGGVTGTQAGAAVAGSVMLIDLSQHGIERAVAVLATVLFRIGTIWFLGLVGLAALVRWGRDLVVMSRQTRDEDHFDAIADQYLTMIPDHVRERLLLRKTRAMEAKLDALGVGRGAQGLDVGCGQGLYLCELAKSGFRMSGVDASAGQIAQAKRHLAAVGTQAELHQAPAHALPFQDDSFDFAYLINVVHHIEGEESRVHALTEAMRVLRPGGVLFLHEINTDNPLFRFYMGYVFPLLRKIDDGTEEWIPPGRLPRVPGEQWSSSIHYFTFLPEFVPPWLFRVFRGLEAWLERSRLRRYSAHFMAYMVKGQSTRARPEPSPVSLQEPSPHAGQ